VNLDNDAHNCGACGNVCASGSCNGGVCAATVTLATGNAHSCALKAGAVQCWGYDYNGQVGNGSYQVASPYGVDAPATVTGLSSGVLAIAASNYALNTCALTTAGGVECWGYNYYGELGNGSFATTPPAGSDVPVAVTGLSSGVAAIAVGEIESCALTMGGAVLCWGDNYHGELGIGSFQTTAPYGVDVPGGVSGLSSGVKAIAVGGSHACALNSAGGVVCWGDDFYGQLGNGSFMTTGNQGSATPLAVSGLSSGVMAIAAGSLHTCALTTGGAVLCWGSNEYGQLGNGAFLLSGTDAPGAVSGLSSGVVAIAAGAFHTCALTSGGAVQCWGYNAYGQLGNGAFQTSSPYGTALPGAVSGLSSGIATISAGGDQTCAATAAGHVECWGENFYGELGTGAFTTTGNYGSAVPVGVMGY
jgi:alpha-tubulin suppressor-like RCC1 family protein